MRLCFVLLAIALTSKSTTEARRIPVHPQNQQVEETIQYYAAAEPDEEGQGQRLVLVSTADQYNGLYGQPTASPRASQDNYPSSRRASSSALKAQSVVSPRLKESSKPPPVQTIRNYNKVNDDGSFTFGYEAADGSFKEETRGTDCVVRGKYGYVDPDGNKREFTYVSGNPCDPNAPKDESAEESQERESSEPENVPANYPTRPIRPLARPTPAPKPAVTLYQNDYTQEEEEQPEPEQVLRPQTVQPVRARPFLPRPQYVSTAEEEDVQLYQRPTFLPSTTPASVVYRNSVSPINITPRPVSSTTQRSAPPATTYRPQLLQLAVTPRPSPLYTKTVTSSPSRVSFPSSTISPLSANRGNVDFDSEFQKFQQENNLISPTPSPLSKTTPRGSQPATGAPSNVQPTQQIYSSALVFDPASGQYNTQLYQTLPQTDGEFTLNHRIQPYVYQPQRPLVNIQQLQQQSPLYRQAKPQPSSQALYQQQQAELQFQNSAHLYAQQQRARQQQLQQQSTPQQQYYYIQPGQQTSGLSGGQIDSFLRGHNIQF